MAGPTKKGANANELYLEWLVAYLPGTLEAIARNEAGEIDRERSSRNSRQGCGCSFVERRTCDRSRRKDLTYIYLRNRR